VTTNGLDAITAALLSDTETLLGKRAREPDSSDEDLPPRSRLPRYTRQDWTEAEVDAMMDEQATSMENTNDVTSEVDYDDVEEELLEEEPLFGDYQETQQVEQEEEDRADEGIEPRLFPCTFPIGCTSIRGFPSEFMCDNCKMHVDNLIEFELIK